MMLVDIHCHMLYGVDDGARDRKIMMEMIDSAYKGGVRVICVTPHYNPAYFRCPVDVIIKRYGEALKYVSEKYPDLRLVLGNEVYYYHDSVDDLLAGKCLTLNKTRNVLVEFGVCDDRSSIFSGVSHLLTSGFNPVIAHIERYASLKNKKDDISRLRKLGACIQVNAASVLGRYGFMTKLFVMSLIKSGLVDIVADDCHNMTNKAPCLGEAYELILRKFDKDTAERLFVKNPMKMLCR